MHVVKLFNYKYAEMTVYQSPIQKLQIFTCLLFCFITCSLLSSPLSANLILSLFGTSRPFSLIYLPKQKGYIHTFPFTQFWYGQEQKQEEDCFRFIFFVFRSYIWSKSLSFFVFFIHHWIVQIHLPITLCSTLSQYFYICGIP